MIKRIFHPIGQGAFYSERHENFNVIYDCGSKTDAKISNPVLINAFKKDEVIDILFISHFDADHVNKISILKNHVKIKRVVLPLLHEEQKNFLINFHRILKSGLIQLIREPEKFFGIDTDIIKVELSGDGTITIDSNRKNIEELRNGDQIPSGTVLHTKILTLGKKYDWIFIPYNHAYSRRNTILEQNLTSGGFDVQKFKTDINYTLKEIDQNIKILKQIYRSLPKDGSDTCINENSLVVYSGVESESIGSINYSYGPFSLKSDHAARISCIYTGDTDLNVVDLKAIYANCWKYVGTIQIPHHGAKQNFQESVLDDKYYICPISVRKKNKHHPSSQVIAKIISQNSYPILITEDVSSEFRVETYKWVFCHMRFKVSLNSFYKPLQIVSNIFSSFLTLCI